MIHYQRSTRSSSPTCAFEPETALPRLPIPTQMLKPFLYLHTSMTSLGIVCGTGFKEQNDLKIKDTLEVNTPWGTPSSPLYRCKLSGKDVVLLLRHGPRRNIPPHRINHRANIYALQREVEGIIGISSAGALRGDIPVPSVSVPADYINLWNSITFYEESIKHVTPSLSPGIRKGLLSAGPKTEDKNTVRDGDIYVQTTGPRLETMAEVRMLSQYGDLVGMTMASEATLAREVHLDYASLVTVDNYGHGVGPESIRYEEIVNTARNNWSTVLDILKIYLEEG